MKREKIGRRRAPGGFTLVELLLVMGIIVMLVGLLVPAVNSAVMVARAAATKTTILNISAGLEAFKVDWGMYPPSGSTDGWPPSLWKSSSDGYNALVFYLTGPDGRGWGSLSAQNYGPFGGNATKSYGPYYKNSDSASGTLDPIQDAFKPSKNIFYYRYEAANNPAYNCQDNNVMADPAIDNFGGSSGGQQYFELLVRPADPANPNIRHWVRPDYLLISAGADRYWGYVKEVSGDSSGGAKVTRQVTLQDLNMGMAVCDDVCNFEH